MVAATELKPTAFELVDLSNNKPVLTGTPVFKGTVGKWSGKYFWVLDFSKCSTAGQYKLVVKLPSQEVQSFPFRIGQHLLEQQTLSDVIYYFKGQRSSGLLDQADHHLPLAGRPGDTADAHGGWYDATGDYGKHLSHLSFSTYFNPQQLSLTVWSLINSYDLLIRRSGTDYRQFNRRLLDEAMYGADYLTRTLAPDGSLYRSIAAPGPGKKAVDRIIAPEDKGYIIKKSKDQTLRGDANTTYSRHSYQSSYRAGGGIAIAALAKAATFDTCGEYSNADYLHAAENAFAFLEKNNVKMTNDGKENIVDDYCALSAATELYKATHKPEYAAAAQRRASQLIARLHSWKGYHHYWRADEQDRPFFHPSDAGLPVVSLLTYYPVADAAQQAAIRKAVRESFEFELAITHEVNNPFGYSRQLVQDTTGRRYSAFFFPHGSEAAPWWQGENARLASMATAARMAAPLFRHDRPFADSLLQFAADQLNWILGLNPFDACMMQGTGHNNPAYGFFGTFEYTNAPGGIVNGITSGVEDEEDIAFNIPYATTGKDYDWRWAEQWLPHAAWYLWAVATGE